MANIENLIIEHLRVIRADIATLKDDVREIKSRTTNIEAGIAGLKRDNAHSYSEIADQHMRYDKLAERIERIEKRLQLTES